MLKPACQPVRLMAETPSSCKAIVSREIEISSPAASSISISRWDGSEVISAALVIRSSVVSPCAETTTTTSLPALRVFMTMRATLKMRSRSLTEEPPNFCTIKPIGVLSPLFLYQLTTAPTLSDSRRCTVKWCSGLSAASAASARVKNSVSSLCTTAMMVGPAPEM